MEREIFESMCEAGVVARREALDLFTDPVCLRPAYLHVAGPLWAKTGPAQLELRAFLRP